MRRLSVTIGIILFTLVVFVSLLVYGWTHRYGPASGTEPSQFPKLRVPHLAQSLELEQDLWAEPWSEVPKVEIPLVHQITEKPWPKGHTTAARVRAFHNSDEVYLLMEWSDDRSDISVGIDSFSDGCAVMLPMQSGPPAQSIMMGFSSLANIWFWKADRDAEFRQGTRSGDKAYADHYYPFEEKEVDPVASPEPKSAVEDLLSERPGSLTTKERQIVQGRGEWKEGTWRVLFKRSLITEAPQSDAQLEPGQRSAAFAVWDGDQGDRGARKSISDWVILALEPASKNKGEPGAVPEAAGAAEGMPDHRRTSSAGGWSFSLLPSAHAATPEADTEAEEPKVIRIQARRFEFTPNTITLQKGDVVTIRLESLDVTHGFYLDGYGIQLKARPGVVGTATFKADKTGRFSFRCSETCGEFHPYMVGFLTVEPNSRFHLFVAGIAAAFTVLLLFFITSSRKPKGTS